MEESSEFKPAIRCSVVLEECEYQFGLARGELRTKKKRREVAQARHMAIYLCRKITGRSYPQIAIAVGYKDHTTALYACKTAAPALLRDPLWAKRAQAVEAAILGDDDA